MPEEKSHKDQKVLFLVTVIRARMGFKYGITLISCIKKIGDKSCVFMWLFFLFGVSTSVLKMAVGQALDRAGSADSWCVLRKR